MITKCDEIQIFEELNQWCPETIRSVCVVPSELRVLGISRDEAAGLNMGRLRSIYRARSRDLHPDLNNPDDHVEPSIYEINQAYESVKKIL